MKDKDPIVLTGRTLVSGALADIFPSRELTQRNAPKVGDMKLWCHLKPGARVWSGQFRSAIFDGKKWRTFRLNVVADSDVRYDSFDERPIKARRCFDAIAQLKDQVARIRQDGTWGCTFTMKATTSTAAVKPAAVAPAPAAQPAPQPTPAPLPAPQTAARTAQVPATATLPPAPRKRRRTKKVDPNQLTLF